MVECVNDPEGIGPQYPGPSLPGNPNNLGLELPTLIVAIGKPLTNDDERLYAPLGALADDAWHNRATGGYHSEIDIIGHIEHTGIAFHPQDLFGIGIHRIQSPRETGVHQILQNIHGTGPGESGDPDNSHRFRFHEELHFTHE